MLPLPAIVLTEKYNVIYGGGRKEKQRIDGFTILKLFFVNQCPLFGVYSQTQECP